MFRPITLKQLNSLTSIDIFSCVGSLEVTQQTLMREVPGSIPGTGQGFKFVFLLLLMLCVYFFVNYTLFVMNLAMLFAMLIYLVYLTYCKYMTDYKGIKILT